MGITEVVRGRDLLRSTARQILLQRALELPRHTTSTLTLCAMGQAPAWRNDTMHSACARCAMRASRQPMFSQIEGRILAASNRITVVLLSPSEEFFPICHIVGDELSSEHLMSKGYSMRWLSSDIVAWAAAFGIALLLLVS